MSGQRQRIVLIIDDEVDHSEFIAEILPENIRVIMASNGEEGVRIARQQLPDLILMDISMPKVDGIAACGLLRNNEATRHIPVIMLTAAQDLDNRVQAFNQGADDFMTKPIKAKELVARVLSKLRRLDEQEGSTGLLECGNMLMDSSKLEVKVSNELIQLSVLEFNLLRYFVQNCDRVVSRAQVLEAIWRDAVVTSRTVDTHIVSLRKKLTNFNHGIKTIYGAGYIMKPKTESESVEESTTHDETA